LERLDLPRRKIETPTTSAATGVRLIRPTARHELVPSNRCIEEDAQILTTICVLYSTSFWNVFGVDLSGLVSYALSLGDGEMKNNHWLWILILSILIFTAACASVNPDQSTLRELKRSYLPTRLG
jgi:hypothetical protein